MHTILKAVARSKPISFPPRAPSVIRFPRANPGTRTLIIKRYTQEHETVIFDDKTGIGTITLTDHAQSTLGDVVFVELPTVGTEVTKGESVGAVESVKAASDIYSPVSGTVMEVNEALGDQPGLLNKSPEVEGWLCKIKLSKPAEVENLLTEEAYTKFIQ
ncbi:Glycine cleavage system H protein, mitochondrial [Leucoagaricus sp. SymC.cos]|nr:Glycine cleavage system H protein, mitochondrial [Leucoagaricus sp. SymC.cos]